VPERRDVPASTSLAEAVAGTRRIFADPFFWALAPLTVTTVGAAMALQSLWAGPWLSDVAGLSDPAVAARLLAAAAALTVGFVIGGVAGDLAGRAGIPLTWLVGGGALAFMGAQALLVFEVAPAAWWPWVWFGLTSNLGTLVYPILSHHFPLAYSGRANTALNLLIFLSAFGLQAAVGWALELWPATASGGPPARAYAQVFGALLALQGVAFAWFVLAPARRREERAAGAA
jgi:hypothetical protein